MSAPRRVSVIIPAYNAAGDINVAIRSVQAQSIPDIEIVVVDDASTDDTVAVVRTLAAQDPRIVVLSNESNRGPSASRNRGLAAASGEWLALLDADDSFHPERLEKLLALATTPDIDMVSDNLLLCFVDEGSTRRMIAESILSVPHVMSFQEFVEGCYYDAKTPRRTGYNYMHPMFRGDFLRRTGVTYIEGCRNGEDFIFYLDCFAAGARWLVTPEPLYQYTVRDGSLTEVVRDEDRRLVIEKMNELLRLPEIAANERLAGAIARHQLVTQKYFYYDVLKRNLRAGRLEPIRQLFQRHPDAPRIVLREFATRLPYIGLTLVRAIVRKLKSPSTVGAASRGA